MSKILKIMGLMVLCLICGCSENDIITSYEEVVDSQPLPISFSPYVSSKQQGDASTRADVNYLSYNHKNANMNAFKNIPFYGQNIVDMRFGHDALNNYIVGVYGLFHNNSNWANDLNTVSADFMTNQPLLHLYSEAHGSDYWDYSPVKYWPNDKDHGTNNGKNPNDEEDKITFISYYPYQDYVGGDFYRDGSGPEIVTEHHANLDVLNLSTDIPNKSDYAKILVKKTFADKSLPEANLTRIEPPTPYKKGYPTQKATGSEAYTFTFQQQDDVPNHIDFMMGIDEDKTKQDVSNGIKLNLHHVLSAIIVRVTFDPLRENSSTVLANPPGHVEWVINYVKLNNVYDKGDVSPRVYYQSGIRKVAFDWNLDPYKNLPKKSYKIYDRENDADNCYPRYKADIKFEAGSWNVKKDNSNSLEDWSVLRTNNNFGKGYKWMILPLPQIGGDDTTLEVDYDLTYYNLDGSSNPIEPITVYKHCKDIFPLKDFNFAQGKRIAFNLKFYLKSIGMDAMVTDWDEDEENRDFEGKESGG